MSHVAKVELEVKDLSALASAAAALGLELVLGQKTFKWYGTWVDDYSAADAAYKNGIAVEDYGKCQHAIRVPGNSRAYEIGVVQRDCKWVLVYDFYAGGCGLEEKAGKGLAKLKQQYGAEVTKKTLAGRGYVCKEEWKNGRLQVTATKR